MIRAAGYPVRREVQYLHRLTYVSQRTSASTVILRRHKAQAIRLTPAHWTGDVSERWSLAGLILMRSLNRSLFGIAWSPDGLVVSQLEIAHGVSASLA